MYQVLRNSSLAVFKTELILLEHNSSDLKLIPYKIMEVLKNGSNGLQAQAGRKNYIFKQINK